MMHTSSFSGRTILSLALAGFLSLAIAQQGTARAQENEAAAGNADSADRQRIETIIREYLLENPEIMIEVQEALQKKQQAEIASRQQETLQSSHEQIYAAPYQIEIGSDAPDAIRIVEFFDYNCGYCKRAMDDMHRLLADDNKLRFILKEFPVLGEGSIEASRVSMAFSRVMPEKHAEFHVELLGLEGPKDGGRAMELAVSMGAEREKLVEEMDNPAIIATIQTTYEIANSLGITGTPSYIIGNEVVSGAVGYDELMQQIEATRTQ